MCTFTLNIHVTSPYVYSLILHFKNICLTSSEHILFCKYKYARRTCLCKRLCAFSSRTVPLLYAYLSIFLSGIQNLPVAKVQQNI